jgi:TM2 domain-containing membrane protein YozV
MNNIIARLQDSPRQPKIAMILALLGVILPLPITGLHKLYLGQYLWGMVYLALSSTPIPRIACAIDLVWYLLQNRNLFDGHYNSQTLENSPSQSMNLEHVQAVSLALEKLEQLRQQGLVTEMEFEEKRRQLLERI